MSLLDHLGARLRPSRRRLSFAYLRGEGLEIGALHAPFPVRNGVRVRYVDIATREESIRKFPELDPASIVEPDFVTDGFTLDAVEAASHDFVLASHVLEHTPNPLGVLARWERVVREGGLLFVVIPLAAKCFDRERSITPLDHMIEDALCAGDVDRFRRRNREHYREWITLSEPIALRERGETPGKINDLEAHIDERAARGDEIHFHTFTRESFAELLAHFADGRFDVLTVADCGREAIGVLRKR